MMSEPLLVAVEAAQAAGGFLRANFGRELAVDANEAHDIKIELDRRTQRLIENILLSRYPEHAVLGEEGTAGDPASESEWIVDPIDGTVNFFYGVPHFAVSIALRVKGEIRVGVIYDPMRDELWAVDESGPATLNGRPVHVSTRRILGDAIVSVGVSKSLDSIDHGVPLLDRLVRSVKKCRMMGSAALDTAYVSCGRLDAYIEKQISIWDVAAGKLLVERAGGSVRLTPDPQAPGKFSIVAASGLIDYGV